jgi:uncharacterized protein YqjF (DUF2071 family)
MVRPALDRRARRAPPWLVRQRWEDMLFAHWPVDAGALARLLPAGVEPGERDGSAWVGIVAFVMTGTRSAFWPGLPALPAIPELNVRTYVRVRGVPAVWFLSLDASSPFFVSVGRALYGLRYHLARMTTVRDGDRVHYLSVRGRSAFAASYGPTGPPKWAHPGSLEHFLVERYRLFSERRGRLITAEVDHAPWLLQPAEAQIELNRMAPPGVPLSGRPLLHFARGVDAQISAPTPVANSRLGPA